MTKNAADAPNIQAQGTTAAEPEPIEPRYPTNPADWRAQHYMALFGRISRAWDACPDELKANLMTMVLPLFSERR